MKRIRRSNKKHKWDPNHPRAFYINEVIPEDADPEVILHHNSFSNNKVKTSTYTIWNFLPKNLFNQFRRIANFYFLCLCIIHFSTDSPVSPLTTFLPLLFVVTVTGVKQGYEDWKRHKEDNIVNKRKASVVKNGQLTEIEQHHIRVGDIVKVAVNEEFPCDLLFLLSSNEKPQCDVTTANLDGESHIKTFYSPFGDSGIVNTENIWAFSGLIECQHPKANLYDFKGRLDVLDVKGEFMPGFSLTTDHLLLKGAHLKNTDYIYGVAVYTGKESKMLLNWKLKTSKFSTAERTCNYFLLACMVLLVVELTLTAVFKAFVIDIHDLESIWYIIPMNISSKAKMILGDSFDDFVLLSYIIPISLYVTLEVQKFLGSFFFQWDEEMRNPETGEFAICNTSDLNEELGQVDYLFTDKTGTLTENSMSFRQCSVYGVKFTDSYDKLIRVDRGSTEELSNDTEDPLIAFLITLSLCHTVQAKKVNIVANGYDNTAISLSDSMKELSTYVPHIEYFASSPDEKALVEACAKYGVVFMGFTGEQNNQLEVKVQEESHYYKPLKILEFDSDRKMMSVIVRNLRDHQIWLLSKGAESSIIERSNFILEEEMNIRNITMEHINDFAQLGLRTLAIARRKMTEEEFRIISEKLEDARREIKDREKATRAVMDEVEIGLSLLGATGVEDLLQEGVRETLENLIIAGMKIWVLTGDKVETAVNIAYLSGLFKRSTTLIYLTHINELATTKLELHKNELKFKHTEMDFGLVVDGTALILLLNEFKEVFFQICNYCTSVVCCRMTPKQKAEIVRLVKVCSPKRTVCAAVGDGANDVSMIQEAHLGIGIMGREGRQAARSSDFAIGRFRFLNRAFLVHGHWYYTRISTLILYSFYKNIAFITPQLFFAFDSIFSTQSVYQGCALTFFNTLFTAVPVIVYGLFEQVHSDRELLSKPHLYKNIRGNKCLSWKMFLAWIAMGFWHAAVLYYGLKFATVDTAFVKDNKTQDLFLFGLMLVTNVILTANLKLLINSRYHTSIFGITIFLTLCAFYVLYVCYSASFISHEIFWTFFVMHENPTFYLVSLLLIVTCLLPEVIVHAVGSLGENQSLMRSIKELPVVQHLRGIPRLTQIFKKAFYF